MSIKDDVRQMKLIREINKRRTIRQRGVGIIMSDAEWENYQNTFCQACGGKKENPKPWFGQTFCGECVEAFKVGKDRK